MFRLRLSLAFGALVALVCLQAAVVFWGSQRTDYYAQHSRLASDILSELVELSANKQRLRVWAAQLLMNAAPADDVRERRVAAMEAGIRTLRGLAQTDLALWEHQPLFDARREQALATALRLKEAVDLLERNVTEVKGQLRRLKPLDLGADFASAWQQQSQVFDVSQGQDLRLLIDAAIARQKEAVPAARQAADDALAWLRLQAVGMALLSLVAATVMGLRLHRRLQRPLDRLLAGTQALQAGELGHRIALQSPDEPPGTSRDEFDRVAQNFNAMAGELQQHRLDAEAARQRLEEAVDARTAELRTAHETLQRIDERRRQLFADLSHELRTPATAIRGEAEIALRGRDKPVDDYKQSLERIVGGVTQLAGVIDDLLLVARAEADQLAIRPAPVAWADLLRDASEQARALGALQGVAVRLDEPTAAAGSADDGDSEGVLVQADRERLRQALIIVLDNAVRYSHAGGLVEVSWQAGAHDVQAVIRDHGIGIDAAELPEVFERFTRGRRARAHRADGSGLGLAIARAIVAAHHGHIELDSRSGEGTCVRIAVPRAAAGAERRAA